MTDPEGQITSLSILQADPFAWTSDENVQHADEQFLVARLGRIGPGDSDGLYGDFEDDRPA